ncbi:hypothetical protein Hs30E_14380 [Lactococcus hodotermopsidis]|uniref:Gram-positive cocci surface proteins LPxTG domain-containing protein n=1 Tax=Pseudolactococcus hodotermopsidis TaxID=2709157 RepID=A0A6A0BGH6_9LACT|nr:KxYKxGKxW signal peptide domain-containing protein [Lactococcus hodotermopsidis]GFH42887.1 hypothetical protein Hs30E_14380 [Lactococcus hodotermopsidis]
MKKLTSKHDEHKLTHYRSWKSGKQWLFAASLLAALSGGVVATAMISSADDETTIEQKVRDVEAVDDTQVTVMLKYERNQYYASDWQLNIAPADNQSFTVTLHGERDANDATKIIWDFDRNQVVTADKALNLPDIPGYVRDKNSPVGFSDTLTAGEIYDYFEERLENLEAETGYQADQPTILFSEDVDYFGWSDATPGMAVMDVPLCKVIMYHSEQRQINLTYIDDETGEKLGTKSVKVNHYVGGGNGWYSLADYFYESDFNPYFDTKPVFMEEFEDYDYVSSEMTDSPYESGEFPSGVVRLKRKAAKDPNEQKIILTYVDDDDNGKVIKTLVQTGVAGETETAVIDETVDRSLRGYAYNGVGDAFTWTFDTDNEVDQTGTVHLKHKHTVDTYQTSVTVFYDGLPDDKALAPHVQTITWHRERDEATYQTVVTPLNGVTSFDAVESPVVAGYTPNIKTVAAIDMEEAKTDPWEPQYKMSVPYDQIRYVTYFKDDQAYDVTATLTYIRDHLTGSPERYGREHTGEAWVFSQRFVTTITGLRDIDNPSKIHWNVDRETLLTSRFFDDFIPDKGCSFVPLKGETYAPFSTTVDLGTVYDHFAARLDAVAIDAKHVDINNEGGMGTSRDVTRSFDHIANSQNMTVNFVDETGKLVYKQELSKENCAYAESDNYLTIDEYNRVFPDVFKETLKSYDFVDSDQQNKNVLLKFDHDDNVDQTTTIHVKRKAVAEETVTAKLHFTREQVYVGQYSDFNPSYNPIFDDVRQNFEVTITGVRDVDNPSKITWNIDRNQLLTADKTFAIPENFKGYTLVADPANATNLSEFDKNYLSATAFSDTVDLGTVVDFWADELNAIAENETEIDLRLHDSGIWQEDSSFWSKHRKDFDLCRVYGYTPNPQKIIFNFLDDETGQVVRSDVHEGVTDGTFDYGSHYGQPDANGKIVYDIDIAELLPAGYEYVNPYFDVNPAEWDGAFGDLGTDSQPHHTFDNEDDIDQTATIHLKHKHTQGTLETKSTVNYTGLSDDKKLPSDVQTIIWETDKDEVTGVTTYKPKTNVNAVTSPVIAGYTADKTTVSAPTLSETTTKPEDRVATVNYVAEETVTATLTYERAHRNIYHYGNDPWGREIVIDNEGLIQTFKVKITGTRDVNDPTKINWDIDRDKLFTSYNWVFDREGQVITNQGSMAANLIKSGHTLRPTTETPWSDSVDLGTIFDAFATELGAIAADKTQVNFENSNGITDYPRDPSLIKEFHFDANPQKMIITFVDDDNKGAIVHTEEVTGVTATPFPEEFEHDYTSEMLMNLDGSLTNYEYVSNSANPDNRFEWHWVFDAKDDIDQTATIHLKHKHTQGTLETKSTVNYTGLSDDKKLPSDVQTITWETDKDEVTGVTTYKPKSNANAVTSPVIAGYTADKTTVSAPTLSETTTKPEDRVATVNYVAEETVTATLTYERAHRNIYHYGNDPWGREIVIDNEGLIQTFKVKITGTRDVNDPTKINWDIDRDKLFTSYNWVFDSEGQVITNQGSMAADLIKSGHTLRPTTETPWSDSVDLGTIFDAFATELGAIAADKTQVNFENSNGIDYPRDPSLIKEFHFDANPQKMIITFVDDDNKGAIVHTEEVTGVTATPFPEEFEHDYTSEMLMSLDDSLTNYEYVSNSANPDNRFEWHWVFDAKDDIDQTATIHLKHKHTQGTLETKSTVNYTGLSDDKKLPSDVQTIIWETDKDEVTGVTTYKPKSNANAVTSPVIAGYTADKTTVSAPTLAETTALPEDTTTTVTYTANAPVVGKEVTATVSYKRYQVYDDERQVWQGWLGVADTFSYAEQTFTVTIKGHRDVNDASQIIWDVDRNQLVMANNSFAPVPTIDGYELINDGQTAWGDTVDLGTIIDNLPDMKATVSEDSHHIDYVASSALENAKLSAVKYFYYAAHDQKHVINYVDENGQIVKTQTEIGKSNTYLTLPTIVPNGYEVVSANSADVNDNEINIWFDERDSVDQVTTVQVKATQQLFSVTFLDDTTGQKLEVKALTPEAVEAEIASYIAKGYVVKSNNLPMSRAADTDVAIHLVHGTKRDVETKAVNFVVNLVPENGGGTPKQVTLPATMLRMYSVDLVTGKVVPTDDLTKYDGATPNLYVSDSLQVKIDSTTGAIDFDLNDLPELTGYTVKKLTTENDVVNFDNPKATVTAEYVPTGETGTPESEQPETEAPESSTPKPEQPETEAPETDTPKPEQPETEAPESETPRPEQPETEAPESDTPTPEQPETEAPESETSKPEQPETEAPESDTPTPEQPETEAPESDTPTPEQPETEAPESDTPTPEQPETEAPESSTPTPEQPETDTPESDKPKSDNPDNTNKGNHTDNSTDTSKQKVLPNTSDSATTNETLALGLGMVITSLGVAAIKHGKKEEV